MNSNAKGKRGEREWASVCRANGFDARRGQQYAGNPEAPDVVCEPLSDFHMEVKRVERLNIVDAVDQAKRDAGDKLPIVAHRKNHCEWLVTMRAEDWFALVREWAA